MSALNTASYFRTRVAHSDRATFDQILARLGSSPREDDDVKGS